jgi:DNA polymerase
VTDRPAIDSIELARLLRQRSELAAPPIFLGRDTREEFLARVRAIRAAAPVDANASGDPRARKPSPGPSAGERMAARAARERASAAADSSSISDAPTGAPSPDRVSAGDRSEMDYDALREHAMGCTRCGLAETRNSVVFSDGHPAARLVVVGEAPGANEDRTGLPFVGAAGKLLDLMLASVDLSREDSVYICNVLKCRPPGNRNPQAEEIQACSPFLKRQLALVQPEALLAVGTFAAQLLTGRDRPLGRLRGEVHSYEGIPVVVTYHPAALLRNSGWVRPTWDDLQLLRQVMDG